MTKPVLFAAFEAGAAAWMAPVWIALAPARRLLLSPVALGHARRRGADVAGARLLGDDDDADVGNAGVEDARALFLSATGRAAEARLVAAARERGIPSLQVIDTWGPYRRRFVGEAWPDRVAVVDEAARAEAVSEGVPAERLVVVGQPAWEAAPALPPGRADTVAFASQPVRAAYGATLGFDETSAWAVLEAALAAAPGRFAPPIYIMHPEESDLAARAGRATHEAEAALAEAAALVGMFSSLMVDALLSGRRVVSLQPGLPASDPCPLSRHGRIARAGDAGALLAALDAAPADAAALRRSLAGSRDRALALLDGAVSA